MKEKYKLFNKKELKKELATLKKSNADIVTIKYVAKLIRFKLTINVIDVTVAIGNDEEIKNFWGYVKKVLSSKSAVLSTIDKNVCTHYFKRILSWVNPSKLFTIPSWIPALEPPKDTFNSSAPSYHEMCKIIKCMKSSGSPFKFQ